MKKRVLMSLVLLAIIGTSAVFAQQPTLDKLNNKFTKYNNYNITTPLNQDISGAVVIPATYDGLPVAIGNFSRCSKITSLIIPAGVKFYAGGFNECPALTSITFGDSNFTTTQGVQVGLGAFDGDLLTKYKAGGAGTYTREVGGKTWTKQGGFSLNGVWTRSDGMKITITENGQDITITGDKPNNGGKLNDTYTKR